MAEVVASETRDGPGAIWLKRPTVPSKAVVRLTMMVAAAVLFFDIARQKGFKGNGLTLSVFGSIVPGFTVANTAFSTEHPLVRWHLELTIVLLCELVVFAFYRLLELCGLGFHYMWTAPDRVAGAANRLYAGNLR